MEVFERWPNLAPFVAAVVFSVAFETVILSILMPEWLSTLKEWQTLAAGLIALGAALLTVRVLKEQIKALKQQTDQTRREIEDRRRRRLLASRALMPQNLGQIVKYTEDCAHVAEKAIRELRGEKVLRKDETLEPPSLSDNVLDRLSDLIEHLPLKDAEAVVDLFSCYQVQRARFAGTIDDINNPSRSGVLWEADEGHVDFILLETVRLHLLAENMLPFARGTVDEIPEPSFTDDQVDNTLKVFRIKRVISKKCHDDLIKYLLPKAAGSTKTA